jgi:hypothetical protein
MLQLRTAIAFMVIFGLLSIRVMMSPEGWSQTSHPLQQVEKQLAEKLKSSEDQGQHLASITEPAQRTLVMPQYFQTTEDILALMLERQQLLQAQSREGPSWGAPGGPLRQHGKDPRVSSPSTSEGDMERLMRALARHSAYMETIQDQALLVQEILRHQKMLDQMLQLTQ